MKDLFFKLKYGFSKDSEMFKAANRTPKEELLSWVEFCLYLPEDKKRLYTIERSKLNKWTVHDYTIVNLQKHFEAYNYIYKDFNDFMFWVSFYAPIKEWKQEGVFTNINLKDSYIRQVNSGKIVLRYTPLLGRILLTLRKIYNELTR